MARKKVKLAFIANDSSRKTTYNKRKKGLMKKVNELSTLCGVTACAIIYSPYDTNPEVWPSNSGVERVVSEFRMLPEMDKNKKMVDQETYLRQRLAKVSEQLRKQKKENKEMEMTEVMFQGLAGNMGLSHLNILDLNDLGYVTDQYIKYVTHMATNHRNSGMEIGESSNAVSVGAVLEGIGSLAVVATATPPTTTVNEVGSSFAATTFFNPLHHQQFYHPEAPYFGLYEQHRNQNQNLSNHQSHQQQFLERMNQSEELSYVPPEEMGFPFMDNNHHNRNHHHQLQHNHQPQQQQQQQQRQQQIPIDSSIALAASPSSIPTVASPNSTNNIWFR